jgi:hypothetical protein
MITRDDVKPIILIKGTHTSLYFIDHNWYRKLLDTCFDGVVDLPHLRSYICEFNTPIPYLIYNRIKSIKRMECLLSKIKIGVVWN